MVFGWSWHGLDMDLAWNEHGMTLGMNSGRALDELGMDFEWIWHGFYIDLASTCHGMALGMNIG